MRHVHGRHAHGILEPGAHVGDAHLERGKAGGGAQVPPDLARVLDDVVAHEQIDGVAVLLPALEAAGQARARQLLVGGEAVALEAGVLALGERRGGREHQQVRQEIARLVHEVDAQLVVLDADVHVHAADDEAAADAGEVAGDGLVALALGRLLRAPAREGVGGGGDGGEAVLAGEARQRCGAGLASSAPAARGGGVHAGADLDLRLQELARHLALQRLLGGFEQGVRHLAHEVPARAVDEQVLFLDADGEGGVLEGHGPWWQGNAVGRQGAGGGVRPFCTALGDWARPRRRRRLPRPVSPSSQSAAGSRGCRARRGGRSRSGRSWRRRPRQA